MLQLPTSIRHRLAHLGLTFAIVAALVGSPINAQADRARAKKHFKAGQLHYKLGRFKEALKAFSTAYEAEPMAAFLYNVGQCHKNLGNHERAIFFFEGYLREKPNASNRKVVLELIETAKQEQKELAEQQREEQQGKEREAELQRQLEQERLLAERARRHLEEQKRTQGSPASGSDAKLTSAASTEGGVFAPGPETSLVEAVPPFYETWWFWSAVGAVVIVAGASTAIALSVGGEPEGPLIFDRR